MRKKLQIMHGFLHGTAAWGAVLTRTGGLAPVSHRHHPDLTSAPAAAPAAAGPGGSQQVAAALCLRRALPGRPRSAPLRSAHRQPGKKSARRGGAAAGSASFTCCSPRDALNAALWRPPLRSSPPHRCSSWLWGGGAAAAKCWLGNVGRAPAGSAARRPAWEKSRI